MGIKFYDFCVFTFNLLDHDLNSAKSSAAKISFVVTWKTEFQKSFKNFHKVMKKRLIVDFKNEAKIRPLSWAGKKKC